MNTSRKSLRTAGFHDLALQGSPVHDTIARVISQINPKQFQKIFLHWIADCHDAAVGDVIAIDGKTMRRSFDKRKKQGSIHMISTFSTANKVVLGQLKTAAKSNEITAIPEFVNLLEIKDLLSILMPWTAKKTS